MPQPQPSKLPSVNFHYAQNEKYCTIENPTNRIVQKVRGKTKSKPAFPSFLSGKERLGNKSALSTIQLSRLESVPSQYSLCHYSHQDYHNIPAGPQKVDICSFNKCYQAPTVCHTPFREGMHEFSHWVLMVTTESQP